MAEDSLHETFSGATKAFFGALGFLLLMFAGEVTILDKEAPRYILGGILFAGGVFAFFMLWAGNAIRRLFSDRTILAINDIAANPRWWLATILAFVFGISLWHAGEAFWAHLNSETVVAAQTQKATLIDWLQTAQRERDGAIAERKSAQGGWAADRDKLRATESLLSETRGQLDAAQLRARAVEMGTPSPPTTTADPILTRVRALSPGDKDRLSAALAKLSAALDNSETTHDLAYKIRILSNRMKAHSSIDIPALNDALETLAKENGKFSDALYRIVNERYYQNILTDIVQPSKFADLSAIAERYRQYVGLLSNIEGKWDSAILIPEHAIFGASYDRWMKVIDEARMRLKAVHDALY